MKNKNNLIVIISILVIILALSFTIFSRNKKEEYKVESRVDNISTLKQTFDNPVLGWLRVQGTKIDYPIIYRNIYKDMDDIDYLWAISIRKPEGENRTTIYGHNIKNVSSKPLYKDDSLVRFEELMYFIYPEFVRDNQYIQLTYDGEDHLYKVYAVSFANTYDEYGQVYTTKEATDKYINDILKESIFDFHTKVSSDDKLITLVTCTRFFGLGNDLSQFKVDAREVRENEKAINSRVTKTSNYDIIEKIIGGNNE